MAKQQFLTLTIKGLTWHIYVQSPAVYKRQHGTDSSAITYPEEREIYFKKDHIRFGTTLHELGHALVWSSGTTSARITADQIEELIWELMEEHYFDLGNWAKIVHDYITKMSMKK